MKSSLLTATALSLSLLVIQPAFADDETDALRAEIKALNARLDALEKREQADKKALAAAQAAPVSATAAPSQKPSGSIDKRLAIVERNQEVQKETAAAQAATTPKFDYTPGKGLTITSPDRQYALRLSGYVQADDRTFFDSGAAGTTNTFLIRSARPVVEAKLTDYFDTRFAVDFGKGATTLLDAYGDFHPMPGNNIINLRAGEFKVPVGLERWQSESDVEFVERGQTTNLVPYRDIGVMAHGQLIPDQLEYQLAVVNGAADLQANTGDSDNNKDFAGRIFVHPLTWSGVQWLQGIGFGVGGTYGIHQGTPTSSGLTAGYATFGQRTYFTYKTGVYANGPQWRFNPQAMYYNGSLGILGEYVYNDQEVKVTTHEAKLGNKAWEGIISYVLTGEDASFDGVTPAHNFDPKSNGWGAFELVGRVSELNVDRDAFLSALYSDPTVSARSAFETTLGGTWYFSRAVKLNLDFSRTTFDGGYFGGADHPDEKAVLSRVQFRF